MGWIIVLLIIIIYFLWMAGSDSKRHEERFQEMKKMDKNLDDIKEILTKIERKI